MKGSLQPPLGGAFGPLLIVSDRMLSSVSEAQFAALWFAENSSLSMQSARLSYKRTAANLRVWQIVQQENVVPSGFIRLRFTELHFIGCIKLMLAGLERK